VKKVGKEVDGGTGRSRMQDKEKRRRIRNTNRAFN
jgi:hypothetical protein